MAVFHTAERKDPKTGLPERDAGSARHTAAIDSAASKDVDAERLSLSEITCDPRVVKMSPNGRMTLWQCE